MAFGPAMELNLLVGPLAFLIFMFSKGEKIRVCSCRTAAHR